MNESNPTTEEINQLVILDTEYVNPTLKERVLWALTKPDKIVKKDNVTIKQQQQKLKNDEKRWGNSMIGQENNGQWTTLLGEKLVYDILQLRGENPRRPQRKGGFEPDLETDEYIYTK